MMERPLSWARPAMEASSWLTPSVASMTSSAMSAASRCLRAMTTESFSAIRCVLPLRRIPAVSMKRKRRPLCSTISSTASRVVPGMGETMARSEAVRQFRSVDLPTLGWPMMATLVSESSSVVGRWSLALQCPVCGGRFGVFEVLAAARAGRLRRIPGGTFTGR